MHFPKFHDHEHFARGGRRGGPFGRHGFDEGDGGRQRQPRGDIKFVLLEMLAEEPHHGYELIKLLEERSGGFYRPSPGMIYPTLQLLEEEGSVTSQLVNDKRVYTITDAGRKLLAEQEALRNQEAMGRHHGRHERGFGGFGRGFGPAPHLLELRSSSAALMESVMQVARYGTPEQVAAVKALLSKANQDVHTILANPEKPKNV
ncbi:MAG: PadR family transcriptional regulator [Anaerolineae bacterium]|nr:PadR family transcriptional regulator [Anaerolineae bacterium]